MRRTLRNGGRFFVLRAGKIRYNEGRVMKDTGTEHAPGRTGGTADRGGAERMEKGLNFYSSKCIMFHY